MENEKRLIDANLMALNESEAYMSAQTKIESPITLGLNSVVHRKIQQLIADTPTVDAVEVVRCRECKHYATADFDGDILCGCTLHSAMVDITADDFCSYGERKGGDGNG